MYDSDDEQSKREFYYHESNNNKNNIENLWRLYVTLYVCKVRCLKKPYNKPFINLESLVSSAWY